MANKPTFGDLYPNIAAFVDGHGFVQIGHDDDSVLGHVVAMRAKYKSLEAAPRPTQISQLDDSERWSVR